MPSFGQTGGSWLDNGAGAGSAFGTLSPVSQSSSMKTFADFGDNLGKTTGGSNFGGPSTMSSISNMLNQYGQSKWGNYSQVGSGSTSTMGGAGNVGGDWTGVEQWSSQINGSAAKHGVSANLIKAVMKRESNGDPNAAGSEGVWGPMQVNSSANAWGQGAWSYDVNANIDKGAEILKYYLDANNGDIREALRGYHGYGFDGYTTDEQYADQVLQNMQQLSGMGGSAGTGFGGGSGGLETAFGTGAVPDWGEFDQPTDLPYYSYGSQYGLSGNSHTGVDVPLAFGAPMRSAFSGTITCAGTGVGSGTDGGGCAAFGYMDNFAGAGQAGAGSGRIEILSDDGNTMLIYGHASGSAVRPGQRVGVGDLVGYNGGMNSAHVHLEARVRDASTPSGWRIVDPRTVLGGGVPGMGSYGGGTSNSVMGRWTANRGGAGTIAGAPSIYGRWAANRGY